MKLGIYSDASNYIGHSRNTGSGLAWFFHMAISTCSKSTDITKSVAHMLSGIIQQPIVNPMLVNYTGSNRTTVTGAMTIVQTPNHSDVRFSKHSLILTPLRSIHATHAQTIDRSIYLEATMRKHSSQCHALRGIPLIQNYQLCCYCYEHKFKGLTEE